MREEIIKLLDQYRLKEALSQMTGYATHTSDWQLKNELEALQTSYDLMLQYTSKGMKDPNKVEIYHKMLRTAYELADRIHIAVQATQNYGAYYDTMRTFVQSPPHSYAELQMQLEAYTEDMATAPLIYTTEAKINEEMDAMRKRHETAVDELFEKIWVSTRWSESEYAEAQTLFNSLLIQVNDLSIMVSAVTMSLLQIFDIRKFMFLLNAYTHQDTMLNQRAIAGIALTCYYYEKRILQYPEAVSRINELNENSEFIKNLHHIQIQLLQSSRETRKIDKKMREEIIPEMMKLSPKISNKINLKDITPEQLGEEMNPEWENIFADSSLGKKMEEFSELQQEGADVMHSTFVHLKSFPFFRELSNWLLPFTTEHSSFGDRFNQNNGEKQMLDSMTLAAFMCNSDKYSLYFSMMQLPEEAKKMMMNQFDSQATEMIQQNKEELISKRGKLETITGQYIQDLYRFFKIYPGHLDFNDIFTLPLDFHNLDILRPYISDEESLSTIAEYYLRKNYFSDALTIFNQLAETNQESDILFQKIGYCKQMNDDLQGALDAYLRADLLNPQSKWVIRRIAGCYRSLKEPEEALKYYRRYEKLNPDNLSITISIGHTWNSKTTVKH